MKDECSLILIFTLLLFPLIVKCLDLVKKIANLVFCFLVLGYFLASCEIADFKLLVDRLDFLLELFVFLAQHFVLVYVIVHHF